MAKKIETKKIEREYTIPLREKCRVVPRYKKTNKAIKTVKEFLVKHMQIRDRDLNKIKLSESLNEYLWKRGIRSPPNKVSVKATKEGDIVRVELSELTQKQKKKIARLEKREKIAEEKKKPVEKKEEKKKTEEEKTEEKEKEKSNEEQDQEQAKEDKKVRKKEESKEKKIDEKVAEETHRKVSGN
jgi:large subunit ribosomal protein L31e